MGSGLSEIPAAAVGQAVPSSFNFITGVKQPNQASSSTDRVDNDFEARWGNQPKLTLRDVWKYDQRDSELMLDFTHLGVLWQLDKDHDGLISVHDAVCFREFCHQVYRNADMGPSMKEQRIRALCTAELLEQVQKDPTDVVDWMLELIREGSLDVEANIRLRNLFTLLRPGLQFNDVTALREVLEHVAEINGIFPLEDVTIDCALPMEVFRPFVEAFCDNLRDLVDETQIMCPIERTEAES